MNGEQRALSCPQCGWQITPRGRSVPRFCAVCGQPLAATLPNFAASSPMPRPTPPGASAAFILGLCGIVPVVGLALGLVAMVLGGRALRTIRTSGGQLGGEGLARAGMIIGGFCALLWTIALFR